jgi:hypothetical protein
MNNKKESIDISIKDIIYLNYFKELESFDTNYIILDIMTFFPDVSGIDSIVDNILFKQNYA